MTTSFATRGWFRSARSVGRRAGATVTTVFLLCSVDVPVAQWAHDARPVARVAVIRAMAWWLGHFATTATVAGMAARVHARRWRAGLEVICSGAVAGILCSLGKWAVGRTRPFKDVEAFNLHPFPGGLAGLFASPPNLSFPSGHATLAFATAVTAARLSPRCRWPALILATWVAGFRVLEGAHYVSDVAAGAALGAIAATAAGWLIGRAFDLPDVAPGGERRGLPVK